jgi:heat-inducible transcriptional repressor
MEPRKQRILEAVVRDFTVTAVPVGSQALASRHFVNLSSATIRNELAELEDLGYLEQPHTSAGRIPTDRGYRYFVDFLMELESIPAGIDSHISLELRTAPAETTALIEKVAAIVAALTQGAAVVTAPHSPLAAIKHIDLISLEPAEVLLIALVEGNLLHQRVVSVTSSVDQETLTKIANQVNRDLAGQDREEVLLRARRLPPGVERELMTQLADALEQFEQGEGAIVIHDGVRNLVRQPEFALPDRLHQVLEVLEETRALAAILRQMARNTDFRIVIGSEHQTENLRSCAVVLTTYGPSPRIQGLLGVIGPTRMDYGKVAGTLGAVARHASERMREAV